MLLIVTTTIRLQHPRAVHTLSFDHNTVIRQTDKVSCRGAGPYVYHPNRLCVVGRGVQSLFMKLYTKFQPLMLPVSGLTV